MPASDRPRRPTGPSFLAGLRQQREEAAAARKAAALKKAETAAAKKAAVATVIAVDFIFMSPILLGSQRFALPGLILPSRKANGGAQCLPQPQWDKGC